MKARFNLAVAEIKPGMLWIISPVVYPAGFAAGLRTTSIMMNRLLFLLMHRSFEKGKMICFNLSGLKK